MLDTTVQPKAVAYPTDSRLLNKAGEHLVQAAQEQGIELRQSYARVGKRAEAKAGRYAEPGHKRASGPFVPGEELGLWPNAACKATPSSSSA